MYFVKTFSLLRHQIEERCLKLDIKKAVFQRIPLKM